MEAPTAGLGPEEFDECFKKHFEKNYQKKDDLEECSCKTCGSDILSTTCFVSLHSKEFGMTCAGSGKVKQVSLPYCPKCEGEPKRTHTCVHS